MSAEIKRLLIFFFGVPTILMLVYAAQIGRAHV